MGSQIVAGPTNTVVIDKQRMYWMAGKVCRRIVSSCGPALYVFWQSCSGKIVAKVNLDHMFFLPINLRCFRVVRIAIFFIPLHTGSHVRRPLNFMSTLLEQFLLGGARFLRRAVEVSPTLH